MLQALVFLREPPPQRFERRIGCTQHAVNCASRTAVQEKGSRLERLGTLYLCGYLNGCGGLQCTETASLVLPFRFELVQVAA